MSDILIKGVKMPKSCRDCFVNTFTSAFPACHLAENYTAGKALVVEGLGRNIRPDGCPLVEIPPIETNYDLLTHMSVDELAKWLEQNTHYQNGDMPWEYWLRQEATND